jgi:hypothetical protein
MRAITPGLAKSAKKGVVIKDVPGAITLCWQQPGYGPEMSWVVERQVGKGAVEEIRVKQEAVLVEGAEAQQVVTWTDQGVKPGLDHRYRVRAVLPGSAGVSERWSRRGAEVVGRGYGG